MPQRLAGISVAPQQTTTGETILATARELAWRICHRIRTRTGGARTPSAVARVAARRRCLWLTVTAAFLAMTLLLSVPGAGAGFRVRPAAAEPRCFASAAVPPWCANAPFASLPPSASTQPGVALLATQPAAARHSSVPRSAVVPPDSQASASGTWTYDHASAHEVYRFDVQFRAVRVGTSLGEPLYAFDAVN